MKYISRLINSPIQEALSRGKSILLLGARQTGKTTFIKEQLKPTIQYSFAQASARQRYEKDPALLESELIEEIKTHTGIPLVSIDEVQKIPRVMDIAQHLIDDKKAQFILTGSSARKLKTGRDINLLPGRIVVFHMTPLLHEEIPETKLEEYLLYGSLPGIITETNNKHRETDLYSYVTTYLEQEIRAEALTRNIGHFSRFLELAAGEAGKQLNFTRLSQDIGISDTTIASYYQILEDCLITLRIDPITHGQTKRRLIKSPKYLFFDLGIRRACANEGTQLPQKILGDLFEQFIGITLLYEGQLKAPAYKLKYWRDSAGMEIDYVLESGTHLTPIEVKWTDMPTLSDARHLIKFLNEYPEAKQAYIICRTPKRYRLSDQITVLPWQESCQVYA